ncbi:hypothetical protein G9A89_000997 [Geosiphon pyriformis]|nr:hypothetical protein G9A89_000997 [Geosiphon pyriformis]
MPRFGHSATLIDNHIYFIGGRRDLQNHITDFLMLDVLNPFEVNKPPWQAIDPTQAPRLVGHTALEGGPNNSQIIVYGGMTTKTATSPSVVESSVHVYDTNTTQWSNPVIAQEPTTRVFHAAAKNSTGFMLIYGGGAMNGQITTNNNVFSDFWALDTVALKTWVPPTVSVSLLGNRIRHTASIVGTKFILLGGLNGPASMADMTEIYWFDMINGVWQLNHATGKIPKQRRDHTAVEQGDNIIIYGGNDVSNTVFGDVAVLDATNWSWSQPILINPPAPRFRHTATLVGVNMIVAFGRVAGSVDNNLYVLNTQNWTWLNTYSYQSYVSPTISKDENPLPMSIPVPGINKNSGLLVGLLVAGSVAGAALIGIVAYLLLRRKPERSFVVDRPVIVTHGDPDNDANTKSLVSLETKYRKYNKSDPSTPHTPDLPSHSRQDSGNPLLSMIQPNDLRATEESKGKMEHVRESLESMEHRGQFDVQSVDAYIVVKPVLSLVNPDPIPEPEPDS